MTSKIFDQTLHFRPTSSFLLIFSRTIGGLLVRAVVKTFLPTVLFAPLGLMVPTSWLRLFHLVDFYTAVNPHILSTVYVLSFLGLLLSSIP